MVKKCTSLTLAFSGIVMLVSSIVLFLGPATQVSHFCSWKFWGLTRHYWGALHLNSGILFCVAMLMHTCFNWNLLMAYIKRRKSKHGLVPLTVSLILTLYVCIGGNYNLPPMGSLLEIARTCRMASMQKYGSPPYGSAANYPLVHIARYMGWNPQHSIRKLRSNHICVPSANQSLADVARKNNTSIGRLLDMMAPQ